MSRPDVSRNGLEPGVRLEPRAKRKRRRDEPVSAVAGIDPLLVTRVRAVVAAHRGERGALLPILHALQAELGHVPPDATPVLADELNLSRAEVHGVITFYTDFRREPAGSTTVRICRGEACQALGAEHLVRRARERLGWEPGEPLPGPVTVEQVFCLGNCALGPAVEVDGRLLGRFSAERLDTILNPEEVR